MKKNEKAREGTISPICPPLCQFAVATVFCICGRTANVIKHAKFQVNRLSCFEATSPGETKFTLLHWLGASPLHVHTLKTNRTTSICNLFTDQPSCIYSHILRYMWSFTCIVRKQKKIFVIFTILVLDINFVRL